MHARERFAQALEIAHGHAPGAIAREERIDGVRIEHGGANELDACELEARLAPESEIFRHVDFERWRRRFRRCLRQRVVEACGAGREPLHGPTDFRAGEDALRREGEAEQPTAVHERAPISRYGAQKLG